MLAQPSSRALAAHRRPCPSGPASAAAAPSAPRPCRCRACRPGPGRAGPLRVTAFREDTAAAQPPLKTEEQRRMGQGQGQEGFAEGQRQRLSRRGWAVRERKAPLAVWSHTLGELGPQEVDIRVTHNGLCHTDLHMRDDDWGVSKFPFIPGHEVVGEVVGVGSAVPASLRPGSRVGVGWIANSCRSCLACLRGEENVCEKGYTGLIVGGNHGGFQEVLRVTSDFLYSIPDALGSADAAPLLCAGITVYAPLKRHLARPGTAVAVLGVGGLGHLALQYAHHMGAAVTALDISADKEDEAKSLGAHRFSTWGDAVAEDVGMQGQFDLILNCASANISSAQLMGLLKNDGTLVQVGIPGGNAVMQVPLQDLVFGQKKVAGTIVGGRADMQEMLNFSAIHGVKPLLELMPLSKVNEAMKRVAEGKARYRIVLTSDWAEEGVQGQGQAAAAAQV